MQKILTVASSEFSTLVRSKAFAIGIILLPIVMAGSMALARATRNAVDTKERVFAIVDHSATLAPLVAEAARTDNSGSGTPRPKFTPLQVALEGRTVDTVRLELSEKVRREELFAFVEVPADILSPDTKSQLLYYSNHPSYLVLPQWLGTTVNQAVQHVRLQNAGVDPVLVRRLTRPVRVDQLGLVSRDAGGGVGAAKHVDRVRTQLVPFAFLILMFMTIMSSAPQLLNSVIEEKMSRISEVLIGSVTPFQLMLGKLLGGAAVCTLLAVFYVCSALAVAQYWGYGGVVTLSQLAWFGFFQLMAAVLFGSVFVALGAACTDLKDSQHLMGPVMLFMMLPMLTAGAVLRAPDGTIATVLSMIPTATPFLMMLRIALHPGPPMWQVAVSVVLVIGTVLFCVWAAGRIFRTGLLMQGKSASFGEIVRWVRQG